MLSETSPAREKNGAYGRPFVGDAGCGEVLDRHLHRAGGISSLRPAPGDASVTTAWRGVFRREVRVESGQQRPPLGRPSPWHRSRGVPGSWSRGRGLRPLCPRHIGPPSRLVSFSRSGLSATRHVCTQLPCLHIPCSGRAAQGFSLGLSLLGSWGPWSEPVC